MNSTDLSVGSRPMSAKELTSKAKDFDWNPRIGFKYWARAAETIHHEVLDAPRVYPNNRAWQLTFVHPSRVKSISEKGIYTRHTLFSFDILPLSSSISAATPKRKSPRQRKPSSPSKSGSLA